MEHRAWYEFVLDSAMLNDQLMKCSMAQKVDVLNRLLYQIHLIPKTADLPQTVQTTAAQKKQDIQTICLKFASELYWDITLMLDNIQPCLVENLLNYLVKFTKAADLAPNVDFVADGQLSVQQTSLIMWYLWVVLSWIKGTNVRSGVRPDRSLPLPKLAVTVVSGLTNPVTMLTNFNENSANLINREVANAVTVLSALSQRVDILAFLLPKTSAFLLSSSNSQQQPAVGMENEPPSSTTPVNGHENNSLLPCFQDNEFILVRWSVLRAKITFVLFKYYLLLSDYEKVSSIYPTLQELLADIPSNSDISENCIAVIDQSFCSNAFQFSQAILTKSDIGSVIVETIVKDDDVDGALVKFENSLHFSADRRLERCKLPSSFYLSTLQLSSSLNDKQVLYLKLFFIVSALLENQAASFIANASGLSTAHSDDDKPGELVEMALQLFEKYWPLIDKRYRKSLVGFIEHLASLNPIKFCPVISPSPLCGQPEFLDEASQFVLTASVSQQPDVEMMDEAGKTKDQAVCDLVYSVLHCSPMEQLRGVFKVNEIKAVVSTLKPSSIDEMAHLLSPHTSVIPRRVVTALASATQIPNASFTLTFIVKAKLLMEVGLFDEASQLLKEAQELASHLSAKVYNYVNCSFFTCEFERTCDAGSSMAPLFINASTLIKEMLAAVDDEMIDSSDAINLYVLMASAGLNGKLQTQLRRPPLSSPIFLFARNMSTLHMYLTEQQQQQDGSSPYNEPRDVKSAAKFFYDIIVQLHLCNEQRGDRDGNASTTGSNWQSRQDQLGPPGSGRPSFRDRASMGRGGPPNANPEGFDDPKWKSHYELRFWWNFYSRIKDPQLLIYLISCYSKLYQGIRTDLACDVYNPYYKVWPSSVSSQLETKTKSSVGETLHFLLDKLTKLAPYLSLSWRLFGDLQVAINCPGQALSSYCRLVEVASKSFSFEPDCTVIDDSVLRSIIRCFTHLRCPMKVAVTTQFLSDPDYCSAFQSMIEYWTTSTDADDTIFPFVVDPVLLEFLINFYESRGCSDVKKALLVQVAHKMTPDLNPFNPPAEAAKAAVKLNAKLGFFKMCFYEYCCS